MNSSKENLWLYLSVADDVIPTDWYKKEDSKSRPGITPVVKKEKWKESGSTKEDSRTQG